MWFGAKKWKADLPVWAQTWGTCSDGQSLDRGYYVLFHLHDVHTHITRRQRCSHKVLSFKNSKTIKIRNWNGILTWCEYFNAKKNAHFWILIFNSESCLNLRESDYTVSMIPLIIISGTGRYDHTPVLFFRLAGLVQMIWAAGFWPDKPSVAAASDCW